MKENYEPTTYPFGPTVFLISFVCIIISFSSPYWLMNDGELEEPKFTNLGLWQMCFKNYGDFKYFYDRIYDGCYWVMDEEMHVRSDHVTEPFFVTVQIFYTVCFTLTLVGAALVGMLVLCPGEEFEHTVLKAAYIDCLAAGCFGFIAIIIFGAKGDDRDWMPHWEHNYLSWSYALGVIGVISEFIAGILFWVEVRIQKRQDLNRQSHGMLPMETKA